MNEQLIYSIIQSKNKTGLIAFIIRDVKYRVPLKIANIDRLNRCLSEQLKLPKQYYFETLQLMNVTVSNLEYERLERGLQLFHFDNTLVLDGF